jgi:hypothetical protein
MAHPWHHARRSAQLYGGMPEDYLPIHQWFDESKAHMPDLRHRALRHHSEGIFLCESIFGPVLRNSAGKDVPVRQIGEQHVTDDLGWIPTLKDWLRHLTIQPWMRRTAFRPQREEAFWKTEIDGALPPFSSADESASTPGAGGMTAGGENELGLTH